MSRKNYLEYCKDFIIDNLEGYKNNVIHICDLGNYITEGINVDGSATYSTSEAKEYIKEWFEEAGEVYQYQVDNYGQCCQNPFESPEGFHVCMIIEGVNNILNQCETIGKYWDYKKTLTSKLINSIIKEVKQVESIEF